MAFAYRKLKKNVCGQPHLKYYKLNLIREKYQPTITTTTTTNNKNDNNNNK